MMRCLQCNRDYPESQGFCHQCGEPLQPRDASVQRPMARGRSEGTLRRARTGSGRRPPGPSQSLLFATVAFPAISTGVYGYPVDLAAPVAIAAVEASGTHVAEIRFVLFDRPAYAAFERALTERAR